MAVVIDRIASWRIGRFNAGEVAGETAREALEHDVTGMAAQMAYSSILALPPFMLLLVGITSIVDDVFGVEDLAQRIVDKAGEVMPADAASVVESFTTEVVNSNGGPAIVLGFAGALWATSNAVGTAIKALNRAYDVRDQRSWIRRQIAALGITCAFGALIVGAGALVALGQMAGGLADALGWQSEFVALWNWATLVGALLFAMLAAGTLYWAGPSVAHGLRWVIPGTVLFVAGWIAASLLFNFYVSNFGGYNRTYGSIAAAIILLVWLYWSNLLLLIGGELNAVLARRNDSRYRRRQDELMVETAVSRQ